jgi:N-acetylmuramic acid 6-phosphate etherase
MNMFQHIVMKMSLNIVSTATMARIGRIWGNYMIYLDISNKKLVDRAARIISELAQLPYDKALFELFYSQLYMKQENITGSPVQYTLERLGV